MWGWLVEQVKRLFGKQSAETREKWAVINEQRDRADALILDLWVGMERDDVRNERERRDYGWRKSSGPDDHA